MPKTTRVIHSGSLAIAILLTVILLISALMTKVLIPAENIVSEDRTSVNYLGDSIPVNDTASAELGESTIAFTDGWVVAGITQKPQTLSFIVNSDLQSKLVILNNNGESAHLTALYLTTPNWIKRDIGYTQKSTEEFAFGEKMVSLNTEKFYGETSEADSKPAVTGIYAQIYGCVNDLICISAVDLSTTEAENQLQIADFKSFLQSLATQIN